MERHRLTCTCGHSWEYSGSGPPPADPSTVCPLCTADNEHTVEHGSTDLPPNVPTEDAPVRLTPGQVLQGFEVLEEINRGGMGAIYKARQQGLNRLVALKVLLPEMVRHPEMRKRFQREVQAAALLSHPNIVTVFHTDLDAAVPYLAMEYVSGIDLSRLVKRTGPLAINDALYYVQQAAYGLQHAFEQGLVHRDIKPHNLMVTPSPLDKSAQVPGRRPRVKILDMGLARVTNASEAAEPLSGLTQAGEFLGTPDYISPEQAEDPRSADTRSDLYSLGGTLFFLLAGQVPFREANLVKKLRRQILERPPSAAALRPEVPPGVDAIVGKLLEPDPNHRFQTPAELIAEIDRIVRDPSAARTAPATATVPAVPKAGREVVRAHAGGARALAISGDARYLLSGGTDETLRLWDAARMQETRCLAGDIGPVEGIAMARSAKWAASCALRLFKPDMVVQLWDIGTGREIRRLRGHSDTLHSVAISFDGRRVASGSADKTVRVWALDQPRAAGLCLSGHTAPVRSVVFVGEGGMLLSGSDDGSVRVWDSATGAAKGTLHGRVGAVLAVAFGGPSKRMAFAGSGVGVRHADGSFLPLLGHQGLVHGLAFSPDGQRLLTGGSDRTVRLWDATSGSELARWEEHTDAVRAVAFGAGGRIAFSASADGSIRRWNVPG